ncbi:hypothetical protein [Streptomyces sp. NPDC051561]|uniref:hypothetical protein n=1 Tax=Streptomyces sp. NPDC051561 TaxID=3365658 RepID=UPI00378BBCED
MPPGNKPCKQEAKLAVLASIVTLTVALSLTLLTGAWQTVGVLVACGASWLAVLTIPRGPRA